MHPTSPLPSAKELVQKARAGDGDAFECIMDRYQERVMRVVISVLRDPMDAEEVTQDVFMTVFDKIDQFREEASFSTWIHRIAVNAALMRKRRERGKVDLPLEEVLPDTDVESVPSGRPENWSTQIDDPVLRTEAQTVIRKAIERLDDKYRAIFVLRDVEGLSTASTAAILGLGIPAVKTRLHRARLFLRAELASYFDRRLPTFPLSSWSPPARSGLALAAAG